MPKFALIYNRVSAIKQKQTGGSLENQENLCRAKATTDGFPPDHIKVFQEPFTGRKDVRPALTKLFNFIEENRGEVEVVYIYDIDRFTRGGAGSYESLKERLTQYGVNLVDVAGIIQKDQNTLQALGFSYDWSVRSPSRLAEHMKAETAREEVTTMLTRTIGQSIRLVQSGFRVRPAPIGYMNVKEFDENGKKRTILAPHHEEANWIRSTFQMRAEGYLSDTEICEKVNALGFQTRIQYKHDKESRRIIGKAGGTKLTPKKLQEFIQKTIYCGVTMEKWTNNVPIYCPFQGLVSIETFNKANKGKIALVKDESGKLSIERNVKRKPKTKENPLYHFKHVVMCSYCKDKGFKGSASRGKRGKLYPAYHCSRKHKYLRIPREEFHLTVGKYLEQLTFNPKFIDLFEAIVKDTWQSKQKDLVTFTAGTEKNVENLKNRKKMIIEKILTVASKTVQSELERQIEDLEVEIQRTTRKQDESNVEEEEIQAYLKFARNFVEHPSFRLLSHTENPPLLKEIWGTVFEELPTYDQINGGTPKLSLVFELGSEPNIDLSWLAGPSRRTWNFRLVQVGSRTFSSKRAFESKNKHPIASLNFIKIVDGLQSSHESNRNKTSRFPQKVPTVCHSNLSTFLQLDRKRMFTVMG